MKPAFCALILLATPALAPAWAAGGSGAQSQAVPASQLQMAMTIYAGGITLGKMDMDAVLRGREESSAEPNTSTRRMRRVSRPSSRTCRRTWRLQRHDKAS